MPEESAADRSLMAMLRAIHRIQALDDLPIDPEAPLGPETIAFLDNSWKMARDGLLAKSTKIRVRPRASGPAPRVFSFEIDIPYKRKRAPDSTVELAPGPIRGTIRYRPDILTADPDEPAVGVFIDPDQALYSPHFSRRFGALCLGARPPQELEDVLIHVYCILTLQNRNSSDPADHEAARYFALDPDAMRGLEEVEPLY